MGKLLGLVGAGVGLARESTLERRARRTENMPEIDGTDNSQPGAGSGEHERDLPYSGATQDSKDQEKSLTKDEFDQGRTIYTVEETDETDWTADDARARSSSPDLDGSGATVAGVVGSFAHNHPPPSYDESHGVGKLSDPVIIPQRRPENKGRGFIRAYAPALMDCGIDQATFLDFVESFNAACKLSPIFDAVNIAALVAGFAPSVAAQVTSIVVAIAVKKAQSMQINRQTNSFLDEMNEVLFKPHGLFCMIMTYRPREQSPNIAVNISQNLFSNLSKTLGKQTFAGNPRGDIQFPQVSPLIFPPTDPHSTSVEKKQSSFSNFKTFTSDYFDKRSQSRFSAANPDSPLAGPAPQFRSRLSDPKYTTKMNKEDLISMARGRPSGQQEREAAPRTSLIGGLREAATGGRRQEADSGRRQGGEADGKGFIKGVVKRTLGQDVLYLMIVNLPSEGEMEAAEILEEHAQGMEH